MLKSVAAGIVVRVAAKVRQNEECGFASIFRIALDGLPHVRAQAVGAAYCFDIERISACMGDVNIVQRDPKKAGSKLA